MASTSAPIETKVVAFSWTSVATGLVSWGLIAFIPSWHTGIPQALAPFIPVAVSSLCGTVAGYYAKHTPRLPEALKAAAQILKDPTVTAELEKVLPPVVTKSGS